MPDITLHIDGRLINVKEGTTILQAALDNGIYIPHLCSQKELLPAGACRLCVVRIKNEDSIVTACSTRIEKDMQVDTQDEEVLRIRRLSCELMFKRHPADCTGCPKYGKCQLQSISQYIGMGRDLRTQTLKNLPDLKNPIIMHEMNRCILCGKCIRACNDMREVGALRFTNINGRVQVSVNGASLAEANCRFCTACVEVCPTGAIREQQIIMDKMAGKSRVESYVPCRNACPAHVDIPKYVRFVYEGNYSAAAAVVREKVPFPESLGYICVHNCEMECKRNYLNEPVSIRNLKRLAAQLDDGNWKKNLKKSNPTGKKVAVIGAGPAGLTSANILALKGHSVVVFDARKKAGGQLQYGIPEYRLPKSVVDNEVEEILASGVELKLGVEVQSVAEIKLQGYNAVLVATGTHKGIKLPIAGTDLKGVYVNTEFLASVAEGKHLEIGNRVMVLGGGNVAIDCACIARRIGAKEVHMACLETYDTMTASGEEKTWAIEEQIKIHNSKNFHEITGDNGQVTGMKLLSVKSFYFDEQGKSCVDLIPDSEEIIEVDSVIFAIGQTTTLDDYFGMPMNRGRIVVDNNGYCRESDAFAAGDAVTGTKSVIQAIQEGRVVASSIDKYLGGDGDISQNLAPEQEVKLNIGIIEGFAGISRAVVNVLEAEERCKSFAVMDLGFSKEVAQCEAGRCLQCDLRLKLEPQKFWGDYTGKEDGYHE